jgi:hypothetical protein
MIGVKLFKGIGSPMTKMLGSDPEVAADVQHPARGERLHHA